MRRDSIQLHFLFVGKGASTSLAVLYKFEENTPPREWQIRQEFDLLDLTHFPIISLYLYWYRNKVTKYFKIKLL